MSQTKMKTKEDQGVTILSPVPKDPSGFYKRLLLAGLRVSREGGPIGIHKTHDGAAIIATGPGCTGYLFATDGIEASESDLFRFLTAELPDGQGINIFGRYEPEPGKTVQSKAHFRHYQGRIMCAEERLLISDDGSVESLRRRSDIAHENVVSLNAAVADPGFV